MRTIKFRGFNRKNNMWLYGFYLQNRGAHFVCPDEFANGKTWDDYEIDPNTLGWFTNLHDKNGREIYEGDVLMIEGIKTNRYFKVWWNPDKFTFYIGHSPMDAYLRKDGNLCEFCIVGNIYDNPELIQAIV